MKVLKNRLIYLSISAIFFVISIFLILVPKLNLGIDMTWGTQAEYSYDSWIDIEKMRKSLNEESKNILLDESEVVNAVSVYKVSGENKIAVVVWFDSSIDDKSLDVLKTSFRDKVLELLQQEDESVIEDSYTNIWKSFGDYIKNTAIITLLIAIIAITFYVTYSFSWVVSGISVLSFSLITIVTLFHDVIISTGLYIALSMYFPEFKIDTFFITALLTIIGYSINDTIVIFDRIRWNLKQYAGKTWKLGKTLEQIIDISVTETLKRSIYTSLTLLFVLITIFLFWPESIKWFILVMIFGTIVGTYSSIFIASPILFIVNKNKTLWVYKKLEIKPEDKIVV